VYEVREVALRVEGGNRPIQISYQHIYATNAVNVIAVTNQ
jgi:hypothetical protein